MGRLKWMWLPILVAMIISSCGGSSNEWTVTGTITGADGEMMVLEANNNGIWYALDSVRLDEQGDFSLSHEAPAYPDIYRLRLGNRILYFPIDSIETITVLSKADAFDTDYTLDGSESAKLMMDVDKKVYKATSGPRNASTDSVLKRELGGLAIGDRGGIVSYYIINKKIGGMPMFDPTNKNDLRIIGAVANAYNEVRPRDPRTAYLKKLYLNNRQIAGAFAPDTIHAEMINLFDMSLYDPTGTKKSLQETTNANKVVLLNFTVYEAEASPAFNMRLRELYDRYRGEGLEIYQVSVDTDEYEWKRSAQNLPWICVLNTASEGARNLRNYNVTNLPTTFVISQGGDIEARVDGDDIQAIEAAVERVSF